MLKPNRLTPHAQHRHQPPSGGCVLKHDTRPRHGAGRLPAAFRRLCVETAYKMADGDIIYGQPPSGGCVLKLQIFQKLKPFSVSQPPSGGCVLKLDITAESLANDFQPPSGGCVLKHADTKRNVRHLTSRLQAAVC